ncbi:uncharacterized protein LOC131997121 [Stomoxys calcitrans]|uniref:uncharacterized protein LOC131997121 n=1 Tax=Stomoxys calcitrans TaxID=35570 RepID=UPI0027E23AEB|nr:uncharacterized protein LOC131997121 [Stomoxys calcitrans]
MSAYIPPSATFNKNDLSHMLSLVNSDDHYIICGDFNSHHQIWGNRNIDDKGSMMVEFIEDNDIVLLNDGSKTFFGCANPTAIDLTLCNPSLALIATWTAMNETLGSGHCVIRVSLQLRPKVQQKISYGVPRFIPKDTLNQGVWGILQSDTFRMTQEGEKFDVFSRLFYEKFKARTDMKNHPDTPWWNLNCKRTKAKQIRAVCEFRKRPSRENFKRFALSKKEYFYTIRSEKRRGWKLTCEGIDSEITPTELWKIIKRFRGMHVPKSPSIPDSCIDPFCDTLAGPQGPIFISPCYEDEVPDAAFSMPELEMVIAASRDTTPGFDGIRNGHIKEFDGDIRNALLDLFNDVWRSRRIPVSWMQYRITPIHKRGKCQAITGPHRTIASAPLNNVRALFAFLLM